MTTILPIDATLRDRNLLGAAFGDIRSWSTWIAVLRSAFGLPLDSRQRETFAGVAGGRAPPTRRVKEFWAVVGRRGRQVPHGGGQLPFTPLLQKHQLGCGRARLRAGA